MNTAPGPRTSILVVEDDLDLNGVVCQAFREDGHAVTPAYDGESARRLTAQTDYDVIVLDLGLPDCDGRALCQEWRQGDNAAAILMLTARGTLANRVSGLDGGADDYLIKPFSMRELLARVRALRRRRTKAHSSTPVLRVDDLSLDCLTHHVMRGERPVILTAREFAIARLLMERMGQVVTREELLRVIWDGQHDMSSNVIDVYLSRLRQRLHQGDERPILETVRGRGYRMPPSPVDAACT